jgi:hypothetical protein
MAGYMGISLRSYRRLEGAKRWPLLAELANASVLLGVPFEKIAPTDWRGWKRFAEGVPDSPPDSLKVIEKRRGRWPKK